eukprot:Colp12_sorted_trinity150504_noHs@30717
MADKRKEHITLHFNGEEVLVPVDPNTTVNDLRKIATKEFKLPLKERFYSLFYGSVQLQLADAVLQVLGDELPSKAIIKPVITVQDISGKHMLTQEELVAKRAKFGG